MDPSPILDYNHYAGLRPRVRPPAFPRTRQARWDRLHLFTVGCRLTRYEADQFNAVCAAFGVTKNQVLRGMVKAWTFEHLTEERPNEYND